MIRCEKLYRRFFIPRLRIEAEGGRGRAFAGPVSGGAAIEGDGATAEGPARGRAKGYAGLRVEADGGERVEVKGMEAARSDWTPLARRFQVELLGIVFGGQSLPSSSEVEGYCRGYAAALRSGALDGELVYRKMLRRPPEEYASASPQVQAALLLGMEGHRGSVSFVMTKAGPEPASRRSSAPLDYEHYVGHQLLPIARAIVEALAERSGGQGDLAWKAE